MNYIRVKAAVLVFALTGIAAGCGGGGGSSGGGNVVTTPPVTYSVTSGVAQKGPLIKGSAVNLQELDSNLSPIGKQYSYQTNSDLGTFSPTSAFTSQYIGVTATGYYFDEVTNELSASTVSLNGLSDLGTDRVLNVNLLTTLAYQRIQRLVGTLHLSIAAARSQAEGEILRAFNIRGLTAFSSFGTLDISQNTDADRMLASLSSLLVYGNTSAQLSDLLANLQSDIALNGAITSPSTKALLALSAKSLRAEEIAANLSAKYSGQGLTFAASDITNWIDQDGDGVIGKFKFIILNTAAGTAQTSAPLFVNSEDVGQSFFVTAGTLYVNGVAAPSNGVVAQLGDSLCSRPCNSPITRMSTGFAA